MEERKATDVILDMEKKLDHIVKQLEVLDLNFKLILNKLNQPPPKPFFKPPSIESVDVPVSASQPKHQQSLKSKLQIALENAEKNDPGDDQIPVENNLVGVKRTAKYIPEERKVPVQQRVTYSDTKSVTSANVEIYDTNNTLVRQVKTNQAGKWMTSLPPGNYSVKVTKFQTNIKPKVESVFSISVTESDSGVELETKIV